MILLSYKNCPDLTRSAQFEVIEGKIDTESAHQRSETDYEIARMESLKIKLAEPSPYARIRIRFQYQTHDIIYS